MKWNRTLQVGDPVGLIGLNAALPKVGVVKAIDGEVVQVYWASGASVLTNKHVHDQKLWVPKAAIFDPNCWVGWLRLLWRSL
jgi:hypothetical protein